MADEKVDIKLKVNVIDKELGSLIAKVKALEAAERRLASGRRAGSSARSLSSYAQGWKKTFDFVDSAIKMTGKGLTKFLGLAIKGVVIEMALLSAALIGIHALFVAGRVLMKAYSGAMSLLAGGAAVAGAAIATVSAAIREQQAAMYAYRGKGAREFGSAMNQTRMAMRNLQSDASLAGLGVETLNKAFGVMSKTMNVSQINASGKAIKALMDFGAAGQDPAQSIEAVAAVVAALSDQKKGINDVIGAAQKLGPEMQKALKDAKVKTKKDFEELLYSGKLAELGGVTGQFDAVNNTLIGALKAYFTRIRGSFADFGDQFLEPLKVAFDDIFYIIKDGLTRMSAAIQTTLGVDGVTSGVVTVVEKVTNFTVRLIREYLPGVVGMFKKIGDWWDRFTHGWNQFFDKLRPFQDGARSLYKALSPIWEAIKRGAQNLTLFNNLLQDNQGSVVETGQRIADLIDTISQLFMNLKKIFFEILPFINDLLSGLNSIIKLVSKLLTSGAGGGFAKALAPLLAFSIIGKRMGSVGGMMQPSSFLQRRGAPMAITSPSVTVTSTGPISYGPGTAPAALSSGARSATGSGGIAPGALGPVMVGPTSPYVPGGPGAGFIRTPSGLLIPSGATPAAAAAGGIPRFTIAPSPFGITGGPTSSVVPGVAGPAAAPYLGRNDQYRGMFSHMRANANRLTGTMRPPAPGFGNRVAYGAVRGARNVAGAFGGFMNFMNTGGYDPERGQYANIPQMLDENKRETLQRMEERRSGLGRAAERLRGARVRARILRQDTTAGRAYSRFGQSATGRLGTSMGLSLMSQYAPEEMRGAMALGGMASMVDPRLGLAVAGVGGALTAKSAGAGALAGAMGGAQIGMMFGPQGAAVGAGIGLVVGGIMGAINKGKDQLKQAGAVARESLTRMYTTIASGASRTFETNFQKYKAGEKVTGPAAFGNLAKNIATQRNTAANKIIGAAGNALPLEAMYNAYKAGALGISASDFEKATGEKVTDVEKYLTDPFGYANKLKSASAEKFLRERGARGEVATTDTGGSATSYTYMQSEKYMAETAGFAQIGRVNELRMKELTKITGKSAAELEILGQELGVNLYDPTRKFNDLLKELGATVIKTSTEMKNTIADSMIAASAIFRTRREQREAILAIDSMSRALRDQLDSGNLTEAEKTSAVEKYFEDYSAQALTAAGGDPVKALISTRRAFESGQNAGVYKQGAVFGGQYEAINPTYQAYMGATMQGVGQSYAGQIQAQLLAAGFQADQGQIARMTAGLETDQLERLLNLSNRNALFTPGQSREGIDAVLKSVGLGGLAVTTTTETGVNEIADKASELAKSADQLDQSTAGLKVAIEEYNKQLDAFFDGPLGSKPEWWSKEAMAAIMNPSDTSTPRGDTTSSRLSQTMSRHAAFDSMLTGNRSVTSSYRTFGLGSINSDHVMGRAYDLTGQNLGQYAKLVHDNGGFAEFHGTMANRHLHVVPGIGDTAMPAMPMMTTNSGGGGGGTTNYYNIEINGTNQSPEQIANMVVAKIDQRERSYSERI